MGSAVLEVQEVERLTKEEFDGSVVQGDHIESVGSERTAILPCQTEVTNLQLPLVVIQDVGGLQVAMQHPVVVQILHSL